MQITGELITLFLAVFAALGGVWFRIERAIMEARREANLKSEAAATLATLIASQLSEYKTKVAETYVSKAGLREFRDEVMTGVRDIKGSVEHITERLDRVIEVKTAVSRTTRSKDTLG